MVREMQSKAADYPCHNNDLLLDKTTRPLDDKTNPITTE